MAFNKTLKFYGFHMKNIMQFFPEEKSVQSPNTVGNPIT